MARLSFAIALNLLTDGFKKGVSQVQSGMGSIKTAGASLAAGLGISIFGVLTLFSKFRQAAIDTSVAFAKLKANSGSLAQAAQNLQYLRSVASEYKLELNSLVISYAKFTAAASTSGFTIKQQQTIFENVQKAMKGYKLGAEQQDVVMASFQKIMTQGAFTTRNFTNTLLRSMPQAKKALADAMGVGVNQINALVKKGIDAKKVFEKFSINLKMQSPTADTNNISSQQNRISNAFNNMASSSGMTSFLTSVYKQIANLIEYITNNAKSLAYTIGALLAGIKISQFYNSWKSFSIASDTAIVNNATIAHTKLRSLESSTNRLKKQIKSQETALSRASADERLAIEVQLSAKKKALAEQEVAVVKAKDIARVADERAAAVQSGSVWASANAKIATAASTLGLKLKAIWSTVGPMVYITIITEIIAKFVAWRQRIKEVDSLWSDYKRGAKEAVHTQEIEQLKSLQRGYNSVKGSVSEQGKYITQINSLLGTQLTNESNINGVIQDRIKLLEATAKVDYYTRKKLEATDRRNEIVSKYGEGKQGVDAMTQNAGAAALVDASLKVGGVKGYGLAAYGFAYNFSKFVSGAMPGQRSTTESAADAREYNILGKTIADATTEIDSATKYVVSHGGNIDGVNHNPGNGGDDGSKKESDLQKAQDKYKGDLNELDTQLKLGYITNFEYNQKVRDVKQQMLLQLRSSKDVKARNSELAQSLMSELKKSPKPDNDLAVAQDSYSTELNKLKAKKEQGLLTEGQYQTALVELKKKTAEETATISNITDKGKDFVKKLKAEADAETLTASMTNYKESVDKLNKKRSDIGMTEEEYKNAVADLTAKTIEEISAKENLTQADKNAISSLEKEGIKNIYRSPESAKPRDTTFDYRSTKEEIDVEISQDSLDKAKSELETLKSSALAQTGTLANEINAQMAKVTSLSDALKIKQVQKDIKDFKDALSKQSWGNVKEFASSSDQIVSAWSKLGSALKSSDSSGWEKIMAIWNALESSVDGMVNIIDSVKDWTEASDKLKKAKKAEAAITLASNSQETASNLTASAIGTATSEINAANNKKTVSGNIAAAGSEVVKSNSKIPIVGIALAAAGLVAILALMGKLPKFATGGIVGGGSTSGDNMLARVNSGEMILNGGQQKTLFNAINSGNLGSAASVVTTSSVKIKGADMYLLLKNYLSRTGKKL